VCVEVQTRVVVIYLVTFHRKDPVCVIKGTYFAVYEIACSLTNISTVRYVSSGARAHSTRGKDGRIQRCALACRSERVWTFSKVCSIVALYRKKSTALTPEDFHLGCAHGVVPQLQLLHLLGEGRWRERAALAGGAWR
jgi:hypothetical protein